MEEKQEMTLEDDSYLCPVKGKQLTDRFNELYHKPCGRMYKTGTDYYCKREDCDHIADHYQKKASVRKLMDTFDNIYDKLGIKKDDK